MGARPGARDPPLIKEPAPPVSAISPMISIPRFCAQFLSCLRRVNVSRNDSPGSWSKITDSLAQSNGSINRPLKGVASTTLRPIACNSARASPSIVAGICAAVAGASKKTRLADSTGPNSGPRSAKGANTWPYLPTLRSPGTTGLVCLPPTPCFSRHAAICSGVGIIYIRTSLKVRMSQSDRSLPSYSGP